MTCLPLRVWSRRVVRVETAGRTQLLASRAYFNSSSQTMWSAKLIWNLFSGRRICTNSGHIGEKSFTAQVRRIVAWSCTANHIPPIKNFSNFL